MREIDDYRERSLRDYVAVIRREILTFGLMVVLVPAIAIGLALSQTRTYEATSEALLGGDNLAGATNGVPTASSDADRFAQTQVNVARILVVASGTLRAAHVHGRTPSDFLAQSDVVAKGNANVLVFSVRDTNPALAKKLVNAYVNEFTAYQAQLDDAPLAGALRDVRSKIAQLQGNESANAQLLTALRAKESQLETAQQVQGSSVSVLQLATHASQVSPRPTLYGLLGIILGLVLGTVLAFVRDALDARARSPEAIAEELGFPILGLVPGPSRGTEPERPAMISKPDGAAAHAIRVVKTRFTLANLPHEARVVMFTSPVEEDGKLAVVANLAVAFARSGRRVTLVDFDLRHASLLELLGSSDPPGVTDLLAGATTVREALVRVSIIGDDPETPDVPEPVPGAEPATNGHAAPAPRAAAKNGRSGKAAVSRQGDLQILPIGATSPGVWEFDEMALAPKMFTDLRTRSDLVLVNAPPLLSASDGMTLATMVDAIVVVASARNARRADLSELQEALATMPAVTLGIVLTDVYRKQRSYENLGGYELQVSTERPVRAARRSPSAAAWT